MLSPGGVDLVWADPELTMAAVARWIERLPDKAFSLTDAVSLEVMRRGRLQEAFTFDRDYEGAGYRLLPPADRS